MSKNIVNHFLNLFWTVLFFAPVVWYWYLTGLDSWWYAFLLISGVAIFAPKKILEGLTFSKRPKHFEKWGVKTVRWFAQDGTWASQFKTNTGQGKARIRNAKEARQYLKTIEMYERFHWMCFIFFLLSSFHAFAKGQILLGLLITLANLPFNWGSLILQQYNKLRIRAVLSRPQ